MTAGVCMMISALLKRRTQVNLCARAFFLDSRQNQVWRQLQVKVACLIMPICSLSAGGG